MRCRRLLSKVRMLKSVSASVSGPAKRGDQEIRRIRGRMSGCSTIFGIKRK